LKGGYYVVNKTESKLPFHLIGLNTNIYYKSNNLVKPDEYDPLGQFKWLKDVLTNTVYDDDKFVHINYEDTEKDPENPRIELVIPIDEYQEGVNPPDKDRTCTCSRMVWRVTQSSSCSGFESHSSWACECECDE
jgi:hypothetical protein